MQQTIRRTICFQIKKKNFHNQQIQLALLTNFLLNNNNQKKVFIYLLLIKNRQMDQTKRPKNILLFGKSQAGKTSFIRTVLGIDIPEEDLIQYQGCSRTSDISVYSHKEGQTEYNFIDVFGFNDSRGLFKTEDFSKILQYKLLTESLEQDHTIDAILLFVSMNNDLVDVQEIINQLKKFVPGVNRENYIIILSKWEKNDGNLKTAVALLENKFNYIQWINDCSDYKDIYEQRKESQKTLLYLFIAETKQIQINYIENTKDVETEYQKISKDKKYRESVEKQCETLKLEIEYLSCIALCGGTLVGVGGAGVSLWGTTAFVTSMAARKGIQIAGVNAIRIIFSEIAVAGTAGAAGTTVGLSGIGTSLASVVSLFSGPTGGVLFVAGGLIYWGISIRQEKKHRLLAKQFVFYKFYKEYLEKKDKCKIDLGKTLGITELVD